MKNILLIILAMVLIVSCNTNNDENDKAQINDVFYRIKEAFNNRNIDTVMSYYHQDAKHDGNKQNWFRPQWDYRLNEYIEMTYNIIDIQIIDTNYAELNIILTFYRTETESQVLLIEEMQYFVYDYGKWQVYGNQQDG